MSNAPFTKKLKTDSISISEYLRTPHPSAPETLLSLLLHEVWRCRRIPRSLSISKQSTGARVFILISPCAPFCPLRHTAPVGKDRCGLGTKIGSTTRRKRRRDMWHNTLVLITHYRLAYSGIPVHRCVAYLHLVDSPHRG